MSEAIRLGVVCETFPDERRVAVVPASIRDLAKAGFEVVVESGAGEAAGYPDDLFKTAGATVLRHRKEVFDAVSVLLQVRNAGANIDQASADLALIRPDHKIIATLDPLALPDRCESLARTGATAFALELVPRITRAQAMDVLSSQANVAGYRAVIMAAEALPKLFPMLMTAAGAIQPAKVFVIGAGVAGLQAIATAKRLGAVVTGYDVRPAVKEQVESLGGRFLELDTDGLDAQDSSGYARDLGPEFYKRQQDAMERVLAEIDVVITTAAIPGKKAPVLITQEMVEVMNAGSVVVDLAAERGGNCELTRPGKMTQHNGVTIMGPTNLPSTAPYHASQLFSKNICSFLLNLSTAGQLNINMEDEIVRESLVCEKGKIVNPKVAEALKGAVISV